MKILNYSNHLQLLVIITQLLCYANQFFVHSYMFPIHELYILSIGFMNILALVAFFKANRIKSDPTKLMQEHKPTKNKMIPDGVEYCKSCKRYIVIRDHHCIFLGQCVDRENYLYFLSYVFYSYLLSAFLVMNLLWRIKVFYYAYMLGWNSYIISGGFGLVSGLFFLIFTGGLFTTSIRLTIQGVTKVQDLKKKKQKVISRRQLAKKFLTPFGFVWLYREYKKNFEIIFGRQFKVKQLLFPLK